MPGMVNDDKNEIQKTMSKKINLGLRARFKVKIQRFFPDILIQTYINFFIHSYNCLSVYRIT